MKRYFVFVLFILLSALTVSPVIAQYENTSGNKQEGSVKKKSIPQKPKSWLAEGMLSAGFSSGYSYIEVSPIVGYRVLPNLHAGIRFTYTYSSGYEEVKVVPSTIDRVSRNHFGGSLLARYLFYKGFFAHAEFEMLNLDNSYVDRNAGSPTFNEWVKNRIWVSSVLLGGGYLQTFGRNGFTTITVLFDVMPNSIYINPIIRVGFGGFF